MGNPQRNCIGALTFKTVSTDEIFQGREHVASSL